MRTLWVAAGGLAFAAGLAGVVLPLVPTVPFMLLAAFCFARGSRRVHVWLLRHPRFGRAIRDWQRSGAIGRGAKRAAMLGMGASMAVSALIGLPWAVMGLQAAVLAAVAAFILTRPSPA